jgi:hypothetical protein
MVSQMVLSKLLIIRQFFPRVRSVSEIEGSPSEAATSPWQRIEDPVRDSRCPSFYPISLGCAHIVTNSLDRPKTSDQIILRLDKTHGHCADNHRKRTKMQVVIMDRLTSNQQRRLTKPK